MEESFKIKLWKFLRILGIKPPKHIVLEYAKHLYKTFNLTGMCNSIHKAQLRLHSNYEFQKFDPDFLGVEIKNSERDKDYWNVYFWHTDDRLAREDAFDKLIDYYKKNPKQP